MGALVDLFDEPACRSQVATAFIQNLPFHSSGATACGPGGRAPFTPDPKGALEIGTRNEVTSIAATGILAIALDGVVVWTARPSTPGTLGPLRGRLDPGEHAVDMLWVLGSFDALPGTMERRCVAVREGAPLVLTAVLEDAGGALAVDAPVRARLEVR